MHLGERARSGFCQVYIKNMPLALIDKGLIATVFILAFFKDALCRTDAVAAIYNFPISTNMGSHMKTTIEVSDALFATAKNVARERQITLRALIEEGLRRVLSESANQVKPAFRLTDARVHGQEVLLPNPRDWQQLEENHVLSRNMPSAP